jgi:hypothetical protein
MTPQQNHQLQALLPQIAQLDALGHDLATVEGHLREVEDFLAPIVRQWQEAEQEVRRLTVFGWHCMAATLSGKKRQRLEAAHAQTAEAQRTMQDAQEKLKPLQEEMRQIEARIETLKPLRVEYENLLRTKETWVKKQPEAKGQLQLLHEKENAFYRVFINLDPTLIAVQRVESAMNDLRSTLDAKRRGGIGMEAVPLIKNLKEILIGFGPAYVQELPLVDRCYAFAAQSTRLMLAQEEEGRQIMEQLRQFGKRMAEDFVKARTAWQDARRERIQYVESYPVP